MAAHANQVIPPLTAAERAARSVFVGNIPYEATEEQLKEIFNQAGPVVSFRLVYDRETGKPKGYGFCEYQDIETAQSAMRNLNNYDFNGRPLRVGVAAGEQNKEEAKGMQQAVGGIPIESPYGDPVEPEKAPEAISKAVASLPPEQMFELMKQMKLCIQNNPTEARNMLLQNPQLAYALLQAQIVMKIVDPQVALTMLHREPNQVPPSQAPTSSVPGPASMLGAHLGPQRGGPVPVSAAPQSSAGGMGGMGMGGMPHLQQPGVPPHSSPHLHGPGAPPPDRSPYQAHMGGPPRGGPGAPLLGRGDMPGYPGTGVPPKPEHRDPRIASDPRTPMAPRLPPTSQAPAAARASPSQGIPGLSGLSMGPGGVSSQDQEKAALIMQVLQLTDAQIAVLPPEQRQSILILKEQIAKNQ